MNSDLEEIKARLNIVDVLGEYIKVEKAGSNFRALCPFHNEKSPSFMISSEKQIWHCFGCQKGGDIFGFVMEMEGIGFREALKMLAEKAGVKLQGYDHKKTEEKNRTLEILELATKWYEYQLWEGPGKSRVLSYLRDRGLKDETIKEFRLGYAPRGWDNIIKFLTSRGYKVDEIAKTGLLVEKKDQQPIRINDVKSRGDHVALRESFESTNNKFVNSHTFVDSNRYYDRFRERIMFPIADYNGKIVGYSARVTPGQDESQAKYVNTPETEVYHKSRILYGLDKAKSEMKSQDFVLLVEGNMDVIAASQAGIKNAVAVSGTALTPDQIGIIKRYTPKVKMFFDMDSAGQSATKKSMKLCFGADMNVEVVSIPQGKDAADVARENPEKLKSAVERSKSAMEHLLAINLAVFDKDKVEDKKKISEIMIDMLSAMSSAIEKSHWVKTIAARLEITEDALTDELKKVNLKNRLGYRDEKRPAGKEDMTARPKKEILLDELLGIMLAFPEVWKKAAGEKELYGFLPKDSLLSILWERGTETDFNWEKLSADFSEQKIRERIEKLFFAKRYRLGLNNELEEAEIIDPQKEFEMILREIRKEMKKEELAKITADLKKAEAIKDKTAIEFLRTEFKKILEEVHNLN